MQGVFDNPELRVLRNSRDNAYREKFSTQRGFLRRREGSFGVAAADDVDRPHHSPGDAHSRRPSGFDPDETRNLALCLRD